MNLLAAIPDRTGQVWHEPDFGIFLIVGPPRDHYHRLTPIRTSAAHPIVWIRDDVGFDQLVEEQEECVSGPDTYEPSDWDCRFEQII